MAGGGQWHVDHLLADSSENNNVTASLSGQLQVHKIPKTIQTPSFSFLHSRSVGTSKVVGILHPGSHLPAVLMLIQTHPAIHQFITFSFRSGPTPDRNQDLLFLMFSPMTRGKERVKRDMQCAGASPDFIIFQYRDHMRKIRKSRHLHIVPGLPLITSSG
jgi:hypothetical protein